MKKSIIIIACILASFSMVAQEYTQTVRGKITDAGTSITLPGANIIITDTYPMMGGTSDYDGNYIIENVPVGRHNLIVSYIGYEDVYYNEIEVITGSQLVLNVIMTEDIATLNEVVVTAKDEMGEPINSMVTLSAQRVTIESTSRVAAGINDPSRVVQSFAGVAIEDDGNNELVVRGNSPRGMLWRMEGVEIPNPNHFSNGEGGSGGGVSALSAQVLDNSDFYTGAFASEYGNAISSVFDLRLRNGNNQKHEYSFQFGLMGIQASAEGPFSKKSEASYLINYRYATLSLLNKIGVELGHDNIFPKWQDLSFNVNIPTKKFGRFNVWGLGGINSAGDDVVQDTSQWQYPSDNISFTENQSLGIIGLSNTYLLKNNKTYFKTILSYSHTNNGQVEDSLDYNFNETPVVEEDFIYNTITASTMVNHKFNPKNYIRAGLVYTNQQFKLYVHRLNFENDIYENPLNQDGRTSRGQAYIQWKYRINPKLDMNAGVHTLYLALNNDYSIEPRLGFSYKLNDKNRFNLAVGVHSKVEPISIYMAQQEQEDGTYYLPNEDLKMTRAFHAVAGYTWNFAANFSLRSEIYYQYLFQVPIKIGDTTGTVSSLNFSSGFTNEPFNNKGTGVNYGLELTLEKSFSRQYYFLFTTSLYESKYTMPGFSQRNTYFNGNYIFNFLGGKEFSVGKKKQNVISINLRGMLRGGYRTIPIDLDASIAEGKDVRDYSQAFETSDPDYFRIDFGTSYRKNKQKWSWIVSLDIQNLTNRSNIWGEYYDVEREVIQPVYMAGMIPVLNFKIEF